MNSIAHVRRSATRLALQGAIRAAAGLGCFRSRSLGMGLGRLAYAVPALRDRLAANLRAAGMDDSDATARTYFRRFGLWFGHSLGIYGSGLDGSLVGQQVELDPETVHRLDDAVSRGKGVVLASPHLFFHEVAGGLIHRRHALVALVRESKDPAWMRIKAHWYGEALGVETVLRPRRGSAAGDVAAMLRVLRAGKVLGITPDVLTARSSALPVRLFGREAALSPGMVLLAMRTGAPLLTVVSRWRPDPDRPHREHLRIAFTEPLELPRFTDRTAAMQDGLQRWCHRFEAFLRQSPADWLFWLDKSWTKLLRKPAHPNGPS